MTLNNIRNNGEIDQSAELLQFWNNTCMNDEHSDVTFIVENTKIPAHKTILSLRSSYFHSLLYGSLVEAKQDEIILKVPLKAFKAILKYIYTGCVSFDALEIHQIIEFYDLAEQYGFDSLKTINFDYLTDKLVLDNCVLILNAANLYSLNDLQAACMKFMDDHPNELLDHDTLKELSLTSLCTLLKRDTFYAPEIDIFKAICNWSANNPGADVKEALSTVRWLKLDGSDIINVVFPSKILDQTQILQIMNENRESNTSSRMQCQNSEKDIDVNLATAKYGAKTIKGENASALLSGRFKNYFVWSDCTYHPISDDRLISGSDTKLSSCIVVDLGNPRIINNISFLLMDKDSRLYSYRIDVSSDGKKYIRLFDYTNSFHRSWQHLYFHPRAVRFIKLVGTGACNITVKKQAYDELGDLTAYDSFDVVELQVIYKTINYPELVNGVVKPTENVAKIECGTLVEGVGGGTNMLNKKPNEFTCHERGGCILLQLNQPYYIGSLRMLLGNSMNYLNKYSFYIETSMDKFDWKMAVDKRNETLSGQQDFDFVPRPVLFIRIKGTQSKDNFICTYFECPRDPETRNLKRKRDEATN